MVLDHLAHADRYRGLGDRIAMALDFLRAPATASLEPKAHGTENSLRIDLDGDNLFALVQRYRTKSPNDAFWEAHRKYVDVQCVLEGAECMGHAPLDWMQVKEPYDAKKDYVTLLPDTAFGSPNFIRVNAEMFAVFMPHDVHMPGLAIGATPADVKKIVVKVRID